MKQAFCIFSNGQKILTELGPAEFHYGVERGPTGKWGFHLIWRRETQFSNLIFLRIINFILGPPWFTNTASFVDKNEHIESA